MNFLPLIPVPSLKLKINLEKYRLAEIVQLTTRMVIFESLFLGGHIRRHESVAVMSRPFTNRAMQSLVERQILHGGNKIRTYLEDSTAGNQRTKMKIFTGIIVHVVWFTVRIYHLICVLCKTFP